MNPSEDTILNSAKDCAIVNPNEMMAELERIERQLIPLLVSIQRLLGKEPSVITRDQRRKQAAKRHHERSETQTSSKLNR